VNPVPFEIIWAIQQLADALDPETSAEEKAAIAQHIYDLTNQVERRLGRDPDPYAFMATTETGDLSPRV
jgi:hypothetical protein